MWILSRNAAWMNSIWVVSWYLAMLTFCSLRHVQLRWVCWWSIYSIQVPLLTVCQCTQILYNTYWTKLCVIFCTIGALPSLPGQKKHRGKICNSEEHRALFQTIRSTLWSWSAYEGCSENDPQCEPAAYRHSHAQSQRPDRRADLQIWLL